MSAAPAVLVTGSNGFIGGQLCRELLRREHAVRGAVRHADSAHPVGGVRPVSVGSVDGDTAWDRALDGVDRVVHLAGRAHVLGRGADDPEAAYRHTNVEGTLRLADAAARAGVSRFVFLSTAKIHGERSAERPFVEDDLPCPVDPYAASKAQAEQSLRSLGDRSGMEVVIVRPPLVYGAGVKANFLRLMQWIDRGVPLPLGSVRNRRSLVYVENLVSAVAQCLERPEAAGRTYLVSDGDDVSTPHLVRLLSECMGRKTRLLPVPCRLLRGAGRICGRSGMVDRLAGSMSVDSSRIRRELGWTPPFDLPGGLQKTAAWYRHGRSEA